MEVYVKTARFAVSLIVPLVSKFDIKRYFCYSHLEIKKEEISEH